MGEFADRSVLVVGASGGIGFAAAELLVQRGARVALTYRSRRDHLDELAEKAEQFGGSAIVLPFDAGAGGDIPALIADANAAIGPIDACINTVGYIATIAPFLEQSPDEDARYFDIELRLSINLARGLLPQMVERQKGSIVIVGSDSGKVGVAGEALSSACRAGVIGFTKSIAHEFGRHNIRMNSVCPGPIDTDLWASVKASSPMSSRIGEKVEKATSLRRAGTPVEAAEVAVFLASDRSSYLTGQAVSINGGGVRA